MAEQLIIEGDDKDSRYATLVPQALALIEGETDRVAALANLSSALWMSFGWLWTGFYLVRGDVLVLGPFQGPIACTRIPFGKGVCGKAWQDNRTLIVEDVEQFPGHIACSSRARSEIVLPLRDRSGQVRGVLDIDAEVTGAFDETDARHLAVLVEALTPLFDQD